MANINVDKFLDLLTTKVPVAHLATINADGTPQVTPVWFAWDGTHILMNTAQGRVKDANMRRDPRVTLEISDPDSSYRYVQLRGRVVEITAEGGDAGIDALAKKYMGVDVYPWRKSEETRLQIKVEIEKAQSNG